MKPPRKQTVGGRAVVVGLGALLGLGLSALGHRSAGKAPDRPESSPKPPAKPMAHAAASLIEMPPGFAGLPLRQWRDHGSLDQQLRAALAMAETCPRERIPALLREIKALRGQAGPALLLLEAALAARWVEADPEAALTAALPMLDGRSHPDQPESHLVLMSLASSHPRLLLERWSEVQSSLRHRPHLAPELIRSLLQAAPESAAELHTALRDEPKLAAAALTALWQADPDAAKRTALANGTIDEVVRGWSHEDPEAANRWALENAPKQLSPWRIGEWARADLAGALAFFESEAGPEAKSSMLRPLSLEIGREDPRAGIDWLATQPPSPDRTRAIAQNLVDWLGRDSESASLWLREQPPGDERDSLVHAFSMVALDLDPPMAIEWAAAIDNSGVRDSTLDRHFVSWWRQDPQAAAAWLEDPPALPAELVEQWKERVEKGQQQQDRDP